MSVPALARVHSWPQAGQAALNELRTARGWTVISVPLASACPRLVARERIRLALRESIAAFFELPLLSVALSERPGQALVLDDPQRTIGLSVSHASGLSLAALHVHGTIGVDLMELPPSPLAMPDLERVSSDYLGPAVCKRLSTLPAAQRAGAFVHEWTRYEAQLKCLGMALTEWSATLERQLSICQIHAMDLPAPLHASVAVRRVAGMQL